MSSSSEASDDRDHYYSDNEGSGSDNAGHNLSDGRSDNHSDSSSDDSEHNDVNDNLAAGSNVDLSKLHLCPTHKAGSMTKDCPKCSAALSIINDPITIQELTSGAESSGLLSRYAGRCDQVKPTIELSDSVIELAHNMITKGQFRAKNAWTDVIKDYLTLPTAQHEKLSQDIILEGVFNKFCHDKRYKNPF